MNEISAFIRRNIREMIYLSTRKGQREGSHLQTRKEPSPDNLYAAALTLNFRHLEL